MSEQISGAQICSCGGDVRLQRKAPGLGDYVLLRFVSFKGFIGEFGDVHMSR